MRKGVLLAISGPSGVGKGTVIHHVRSQRPEIELSISVTTRKPRRGESEAISYYFRDRETFEKMLENNEILEYDIYCNNYYGTPKPQIEERLAMGKSILMDVTVPGTLKAMELIPETVSVFLMPPSLKELQSRLIGRGTETEEERNFRLQQARKEILEAEKFDYVIVNRDSEATATLIMKIVELEKYRSTRQKGLAEKILKE